LSVTTRRSAPPGVSRRHNGSRAARRGERHRRRLSADAASATAWASHHRRKADELAVMFRLVLGPDLLHRRDLLAHLLRTGLVNRTVVFRLFGIPKKTGSHATRRWRERDSNPRSPEPAVLRGLREVGCGALRKAPPEDTVRKRVGAPAVPQLDFYCSACHSIEPGAQLVLVGVASPRSVSARRASAFCR
jgi:hypothetical protein